MGVNVELLSGWGREGIYLLDCAHSNVRLGHAQGHATRNTEYSGVQVSGSYNTIDRASVDFCGASGVGFDTSNGTISNIISTNTREYHGVNFGHIGFPANNSVATNIVVDGATRSGIKVSSGTSDLTIDNFSVQNSGEYGISISDNSVRGKLTGGVVKNSGIANLQASISVVTAQNVRYVDIDQLVLAVSSASGLFLAGETITASGGKSAVVRRVVQGLSSTSQTLFLSSVVGVFAFANAITGGTSAATATVATVRVPVAKSEELGGRFIEDVFTSLGTQNQTRFPDGTAIAVGSVSVVVATGGTAVTVSTPWYSNVAWASAPRVVCQLSSISATNGYEITQMLASSTTSTFSLTVNATAAQTYTYQVMAIGKWR